MLASKLQINLSVLQRPQIKLQRRPGQALTTKRSLGLVPGKEKNPGWAQTAERNQEAAPTGGRNQERAWIDLGRQGIAWTSQREHETALIGQFSTCLSTCFRWLLIFYCFILTAWINQYRLGDMVRSVGLCNVDCLKQAASEAWGGEGYSTYNFES